jgi:hypothetical protein
MSFLDDGADLVTHQATGPGFGQPNPKFYKSGRKSRREARAPYNEDVRRAVSGQITGTLQSMRGLAGVGQRVVEVKEGIMGKEGRKGEEKVGQSEQKKDGGPPPGACRVWIPPPPPHFVIHGEDGRVVVVDSSKEPIDSRPAPERMPRLVRPERERKERKDKGTDNGKEQRNSNQGTSWKAKKGDDGSQSSWSQSQTSQQKPNQTAKANKPASNASSRKSKEKQLLPSDPDFFLSGALGFPARPQTVDSWEDDQGEETKSNYHAPTVESASDSPSTEQCTYMNGYGDNFKTDYNTNSGDYLVRLAGWMSP